MAINVKIRLLGAATPMGRGQGFTMIEVLVTLVILLVGLLGLAGLQTRVQQAELESYQREQALVLMGNMVDRINANRKAATCYAITVGSGSPYYGTLSSGLPASCSGVGNTSQQAMAISDITDWDKVLKGTGESSGSTNIGAIRDARGCVASIVNADQSITFTVAVAWQGMTPTTTPLAPGGTTASTNAINCGTGLYGTDPASGLALRRVVWTTTRVAFLQ